MSTSHKDLSNHDLCMSSFIFDRTRISNFLQGFPLRNMLFFLADDM